MKTCCFGYALESPAIVRNKTSSCRKTSLRLVTVALTLGLMSTLHAANVVWIGGSTGTWEDATNWSTDPALPGTADNAQLLDVTAGTRTVTIDAPETINQLTITQTTVGAFNVLNVNDDLTISGNTNPFAITATAGQGSIITNIAAGKRLLATKTSQSAPVFNGTLNLAAGSIFELETTGAASDIIAPIINGPVNASGAGAKVIVRPGRFIKNAPTSPIQFNGAVSVTGVGSSLAVQRLDASSNRGNAYINFTGNDDSGNSVNLGIGTRMDIDISSGVINFTNRVTLAGKSGSTAGAILSFNETSASPANFNGGLVMGAGAQTTMVGDSSVVTLGSASTFASGSVFLLQYPNRSGGAVFTNNGTLTMDGSALNFDYATTDANNSGGARNFQNTGTWTLKNSSTVAFISSSIPEKATSAYGIGVGNNNSGTFNVESSSKVGFQDLSNTGTMNVGSSTGLVYLGSPDNTFGTVTLTNGVTSAGVDAAGTINVNGNAWLGRTTYIGAITTLNNGSATSVGSVINVGDGTLAATFTMANRDATINNFAGNTFNLNSYATLHLESLGAYPANGNVTLNNNGTFVQAGSLVLQGTWQGARTVATSASGVYRISGANAVLEAKPSIDGTDLSNVPDVIFSVNGQLSGATASDKLTYVNSTGNVARNYLGVAVSGGEFTAGLGSNGSGTSSIGSLEFVDTNITLSGGAKMTFDLGGTVGSGLFDQLTLTLATAGSGAILDLGSDSILDINLVNGFTSVAGTYRIMTADSLTGTFGTLLLNGGANNGEYTVNYLSNGVEVNFGVIPEPATVGLLMGGLVLFVMAGSRRRRTAA